MNSKRGKWQQQQIVDTGSYYLVHSHILTTNPPPTPPHPDPSPSATHAHNSMPRNTGQLGLLDSIRSYYISPCCDLHLDDKKLFSLSVWHSGSWCCTTISSLVTKCSAVQNISSGQTFTDVLNLRCALTLSAVFFYFFSQDTSAFDAVLSKQVWLQTDQQFRWYSRNGHILII